MVEAIVYVYVYVKKRNQSQVHSEIIEIYGETLWQSI